MRTVGPWASSSLLLAVLIALPAMAGADLVDEERSALWESWRRDPLDLRTAGVEELALLPGGDARLARAIVTLRERGALRRVADLRLLGAEGLDLSERWRDLVVVGAPPARASPAEVDLRVWRGVEDGDTPSTRLVLDAARGRIRLGMALRGDDRRRPRLWASYHGEGWGLVVGGLRPRSGDGLSWLESSARSRTGAARPPRLPALDGRHGTGAESPPSGAGLVLERGVWRGWTAVRRAPGGGAIVHGAWARSVSGTDLGVSWWQDRRGWRPSLWWQDRSGEGRRIWAAVARGATGAITHAGLRWGGDDWRVGGAFTRALAPGEAGVDPVTAAPLDRSHRVWQVHGNRRGRGWSIEALLRERIRGRAGALRSTRRTRFAWSLRPSRRATLRWRLQATLTADEDLRASAFEALALRVAVDLRFAGRSLRIVGRRVLTEGGRQEALALRLRGGGAWRPTVAVALAAGSRASPWTVARPLAGVGPLWLDPGGMAATLTARRTWRERWEVGAWTWARAAGRDAATMRWEVAGGLSLRFRWSSGANVAIR